MQCPLSITSSVGWPYHTAKCNNPLQARAHFQTHTRSMIWGTKNSVTTDKAATLNSSPLCTTWKPSGCMVAHNNSWSPSSSARTVQCQQNGATEWIADLILQAPRAEHPSVPTPTTKPASKSHIVWELENALRQLTYAMPCVSCCNCPETHLIHRSVCP